MLKLQHVQLTGFKLQLPGEEHSHGSSSEVGSGDSSTVGSSRSAQLALSSLDLKSVTPSDVGSLLQLTKAPQLTSLKTQDISFAGSEFCSTYRYSGNSAAAQELAEALPRLLQPLHLLVVLELPGLPMTAAAAQQLSSMTGLQQVKLNIVDMPACHWQHLPSSITQLQLHNYLKGGHGSESTAALLTVLASLTLLQDLKVDGLDIVGIAPQQFAAATASSQLTKLTVMNARANAFAQGAVLHIFPPTRQMPSLQHLSINSFHSAEPDDDEWCIASADISSIGRCCPQLQSLDLYCSVKPGADLAVLLQLPKCCTLLGVGGAAFTDVSVPVLLQLTQLKHLEWIWSPDLTDAGLQQLVGLDLSRLRVDVCGTKVRVDSEGENGGLVYLESDPHLGSVSQQLDAMYDRSPAFVRARFKKYKKAAAARERQLQQQLAHSRAEIKRLKQQLGPE